VKAEEYPVKKEDEFEDGLRQQDEDKLEDWKKPPAAVMKQEECALKKEEEIKDDLQSPSM
jgi:hypothetical protein